MICTCCTKSQELSRHKDTFKRNEVSKHLLEVFMTLNSDFAQLQPPPMLEGLAQETLTELL